MFIKSAKSLKVMNKNESGQAALETAIILIAFVVVASVFAFAILSAGSASTDKGKQAINAGLQGVQSSMSIKGSVTAAASGTTKVDTITFDVALVAGGSPVDLTPPVAGTPSACGSTPLTLPLTAPAAGKGANAVVVNYSDSKQSVSDIVWAVCWIGKTNGTAVNYLLEDGELAQITVDVSNLGATTAANALGANTAFTLQVKPPTGSVINIQRTIPAAISTVMELN